MKRKHLSSLLALTILAGFLTLSAAPAQALSGAIFTTDKNNSVVNENLYSKKDDVYISGGPKKIGPAGLPRGYYYFQVTDPSGKVLLSSDSIEDRWFWVNGDGVMWYPPLGGTYIHNIWPNYNNGQGGPIVMQLSPYDDTPNKGGVYKVWVTPKTDSFDPQQGVFGFIPADSKTDNFKVGKKLSAQYIHIKKFKDCDADGLWDAGEDEIAAWPLEIVDPEGNSWGSLSPTTPYTVYAWAGDWGISEVLDDDWQMTGATINDVPQSLPQSPDPPVVALHVNGTDNETYTVCFGNIPLGTIQAYKFYDRNGDGCHDEDEPPVAGICFTLEGTDVHGDPVSEANDTDSDGCAIFTHLLPGTYTLTETLPSNCGWGSTTTVVANIVVLCADCPKEYCCEFGNVCTAEAAFGTKGYWHNKNGLAEILDEDIDFVNDHTPYRNESSYFDAGDEPFDGCFTGGDLVEAAYSNLPDEISEIAASGTARAEISHFLVDSNADGDPREQLAQQLLAFIFNALYRLGGCDTAIQLPNESDWTVVSDFIDEAIGVWKSGTAAEQTDMAGLLDSLNNSSTVKYILRDPPSVSY
jgi:hypothetical protein